MADIPHLAFPVRFNAAGSAVVVEQDSAEEIAGCVETIVRTVKGHRLERPEFGIRDLVFEQVKPGAAAQHVERQVLTHEPRAALLVAEDTSALADMMWGITATLSEAASDG